MTFYRISCKRIGLSGFVLLTLLSFPAMAEDDLLNKNVSPPVPIQKPERANIAEEGKQVLLPKRKPSAGSVSSAPLPHVKLPMQDGPFSERQALLYRDIFKLQEAGKIAEADEKIAQLGSTLLIGHVLAERYLHPTAYQSRPDDLKAWLARYGDHPQAQDIYTLLEKKFPKIAAEISKPPKHKFIRGNQESLSKRARPYQTTKTRTPDQAARVEKLKREVSRNVEKYQPTLALNILSNDYALQFMDDVEFDRLRADIAAGYLYANDIDMAARLAKDSVNRSGEAVPVASWILGLIHWQKGEYVVAGQFFDSAATSTYASGWMVAAASFWASRAHTRSHAMEKISISLSRAAQYPKTFYGLLAAQTLGRFDNFDWTIPPLKQADIAYIEQSAKGRRAMALIKVGQEELAAKELETMPYPQTKQGQDSLLAIANHFNLPSLSIRYADAFPDHADGIFNAALYPLPCWKPQNGYKIDRALIYAIARQESRFDEGAQNPSGATGLMQLMPATANHITGKDFYHLASGQYELKKPDHNLFVGQSYIQELLAHPSVRGDLLMMAAAYNAGPGNLGKWKRERLHIKDPLLFIETIPYGETRAFIERVMANFWIYRMRLGQDVQSLEDLAAGRWAKYDPQDADVRKLAFKN